LTGVATRTQTGRPSLADQIINAVRLCVCVGQQAFREDYINHNHTNAELLLETSWSNLVASDEVLLGYVFETGLARSPNTYISSATRARDWKDSSAELSGDLHPAGRSAATSHAARASAPTTARATLARTFSICGPNTHARWMRRSVTGRVWRQQRLARQRKAP